MINVLSQVKAYLNMDPVATTHDVYLTQLIVNTQKEVDSYIDQPIEQSGVNLRTELRNVNGTLSIYIPYTVPVSVIEVYFKSMSPVVTTWTLIDPTMYNLYYNGNVQYIYLNQGISTAYEYRISLAVGYLTASIPADIQQVVTEMVAIKYKNSVQGDNTLGKASVGTSMNGASVTDSMKEMWPQWKRILSKYQMIVQ